MKNKLIALITAVMLIIGCLPGMTILAANDDSGESRRIKMLSSLGIIEADSKTGMFWDDSLVERREIVRILCKMSAIKPMVDSEPRFYDVAEEDRSYVETAVRNGYMAGYGDGEFGPRDYITRGQMLKVIVSLLGGSKVAERDGGYPYGYKRIAARLGIVGNSIGALDEHITRIEVADLIYDVLHTDMLILSSVGNEGSTYTQEKGTTYMNEVLDIYEVTGIMKQSDATSVDSAYGAGTDNIAIGSEVYSDAAHIADDYLGCRVVAYVKKSDALAKGSIIHIEDAFNNQSIVVDCDDFISADGFTLKYYKGEKKTVTKKLSAVCSMIYNGVYTEYDSDLLNIDSGFITLIDNEDNGDIDVIRVTDYDVYAVDRVDINNEIIITKFGKPAINLDGSYVRIIKDGVPAKLGDIGIGEVISAAISKNETGKKAVLLQVCTEKAMGQVDNVPTDNNDKYTIYLNGKEYYLGEDCRELISKQQLNPIFPGDVGQFFMDVRSEIAYFTADGSPNRVGYLIKAHISDEPFGAKAKAKIFTDEGKIEILRLSSKIKLDGEGCSIDEAVKNKGLEDKLSASQLVEYVLKDGVITQLDFPENEKSYDSFSKDFSGSLKCTSKSILGHKYVTSTATQLFRIPLLNENDENYDEVMNSVEYYEISSGSFFNGGTTYSVSLYDLNENNEAKYAVQTYSPFSADIWYNTAAIFVAEISTGINDDGDEIIVISGKDEKGNDLVLNGMYRDVLTDNRLGREVKEGDVIQYLNDQKGNLVQIIIQHGSDESIYMPKNLDGAIDGQHCSKAYGKIIRSSANEIILNCGSDNNEVDMVIRSGNGIIFEYDAARGKLFPVQFAEVVPGMNAFALMNYTGLRMMIIYR